MAGVYDTLSPEYRAQLEEIDKKRAIAQAMMAQSLKGPQMPQQSGPVAAKLSPLAALAPVLTAYISGKKDDVLAGQRADALGRADQATQQDVNILNTQRKLSSFTPLELGVNGAEAAPGNEFKPMSLGGNILPNQNKDMVQQGMAQALTSRDPRVASFAGNLQKREDEETKFKRENQQKMIGYAAEAMKEKGRTADILKMVSSGAIPADYQDQALVPPVFKTVTDGVKTFVTTTNTNPKTGAQTGTATAASGDVNVGKDEGAAARALGGAMPKTMEEAQKALVDSGQRINTAQRMLALSRDPELITGFGAAPQTWLTSLATKLNFTGPQAASKTQEFLAAMARNTLDASGDLKGAITEKEWPRLEQASSGSINMTPAALEQLARIEYAKQFNRYILADQQWGAIAERPGMEGSDKIYPHPRSLGSVNPDPKFYEVQKNGTIRYTGSVDALIADRKGAAPASKPATQMTPAEKQAEIQRLEAELFSGGKR